MFHKFLDWEAWKNEKVVAIIASILIRVIQEALWACGVENFVNMRHALCTSSFKNKQPTLSLFTVLGKRMEAPEAEMLSYWLKHLNDVDLSPLSGGLYSFPYTSFISSSQYSSKLSDETYGFVFTKNLYPSDSRKRSFAVLFRELRAKLQELLKILQSASLCKATRKTSWY